MEKQPLTGVVDKLPLHYKLVVTLFLIYLVALTALAVFVFWRGLEVNTDIQAIVPQNSDPAVRAANNILSERVGNLVVFAILGSDKSKIKAYENALLGKLSQNDLLRVKSDNELMQAYQALPDLYWPYRFSLLSDADRDGLDNGQSKVIIQSAWRRLLGFQAGNPVSSVADDPLGLFARFYNALPFMLSARGFDTEGFMQLDGGTEGTGYARVVMVELAGKALDMSVQHELVSFLDSTQHALAKSFTGLSVYRSGFLFHAANAAGKAKQEFTLISVVSVAGIILLFLICFATLRPLLLSILSLLFGFVAATTISVLIFQKLHLLTLVFGASLIGVAVDYSLHYFSLMKTGSGHPRLIALKSILPSIVLGLVTTVAGYACLFQASLPGLREIALFCITGLINAWLFVVCVYPMLAGQRRSPFSAGVYRAALAVQSFWDMLGVRRSLVAVLCLFAVATVVWLIYGKAEHNVRLLYQPPEKLLAQDMKIRELFPEQASNQYFLVSGSDGQQLLQHEETLAAGLHQLLRNGKLEGFTALSRYLPSVRLQQANYRLLGNTLYAEGGELDHFVEQAGIGQSFLKNFRLEFKEAENKHLVPEKHLQALPEQIRLLWLGERDGIRYSMVTLQGIHSLPELSAIADHDENVIFVDRVQSLSNMLKRQYGQSVVLLITAYILISVIVLLRYRRVDSLFIVLVPLISTFFLLALFPLFSVSIGLFHILALYLALGLGLDYGIFIYDSHGNRETSVAVMLSALTSSLSFGMLSLSSTPMISAFGLTILGTSMLSLLLAPLLIRSGSELLNRNDGVTN